LIRAVEATHPRADELPRDRLTGISEALDHFDDVYTTNYDCLLYHIVMISKDRHEADRRIRPYNDYFWDRLDNDHLGFKNYQHYPQYKHIYYLHGALFLFRRSYADVKIRRTEGVELVEQVAIAIRQGEIPLFVSEGRPNEKKEAIYRSDYLRFAGDHLEKARDTLVVYGSSLSEPDRHVAAAIRNGTRRIAFALHRGARSEIEVENEQLRVIQALGGVDVHFFWSNELFQ